MTVYTVYKTTNLINGMFYIGVHKTNNPNDDYLGSGLLIRRALKKYGKESFKKEILFVFDSRKEAFAKEKELVTEEILLSGLCYNIHSGGDGGWDLSAHTKRTELRQLNEEWKRQESENFKIAARKRVESGEHNFLGESFSRFSWKGKSRKTYSDKSSKSVENQKGLKNRVPRVFSIETREKMRLAKLGKKMPEETKQKISSTVSGRTKTEEHKRKISDALKTRGS